MSVESSSDKPLPVTFPGLWPDRGCQFVEVHEGHHEYRGDSGLARGKVLMNHQLPERCFGQKNKCWDHRDVSTIKGFISSILCWLVQSQQPLISLLPLTFFEISVETHREVYGALETIFRATKTVCLTHKDWGTAEMCLCVLGAPYSGSIFGKNWAPEKNFSSEIH